jgi:hypothetical protein
MQMQTDEPSMKSQPSEPQQPQTVASPSQPRRRPCLFWGAILGLTGAVLLAMGMIAASTLTPLFPCAPKGSRNFSARLTYYMLHKQWKADLHTLVSAVEYVVGPEGTQVTTPSQTSPVVYAPPSTPPKS